MKLNEISLDQWQDLDDLSVLIERHGINQVTGIQLIARFSPIAQVSDEDNKLTDYCKDLAAIYNNDELIVNSLKRQEVIRLLNNICREYKCYIKEMAANDGFKICKSDNLSTVYYRHLQTVWREEKSLPVKKNPGQSNKDVYGNYTSYPNGNFMTQNIRNLVNDELINKGDRLIEEKRLRENLLSSQPLCFNLFGELKLDLTKALQFFNYLYHNYFLSIDEIYFEYNPSRRNSCLTGDRSAFDVFVKYTSCEKRHGFIGIEVKYSETLREGANSVKAILSKQFCDEARTRKERYEELSSGIFSQEDFKALEMLPFFQIWRDHLLAVAMCKTFRDEYDEGFFLFLSPHTNIQCRQAALNYKNLLLNKNTFDSHFHIDWLENYIDALNMVFDAEWTNELAYRYLGRKPKNAIQSSPLIRNRERKQ